MRRPNAFVARLAYACALACLCAMWCAAAKCYWVYETNAETWGTPLVADGRVYLGTQKAFFVFAAGKEAKFVSRIPLGAPSYCTPIAANGVLYVASHRYLWAVKQQKKP